MTVGVRVGVLVGVGVGVLVGVGVGVLVGVGVGVGVLVGVGVGVLVGVGVGVFVGVGVGVFVGVGVGVGVLVGVGVGVLVGVGVGVGVGASTVVRPAPAAVPVTPFTCAVALTRPSWLVWMPASGSASLVGSLRTSTKKSMMQVGNGPVGELRTTDPESGMNSISPVVASGVPIVNVIPPGTCGSPHAVPARPCAFPSGNPFTRKTSLSSSPAGQGTASVPHDGVCWMRLSVASPPLSGVVEVFVMLKATGTLVSPTITIAG